MIKNELVTIDGPSGRIKFIIRPLGFTEFLNLLLQQCDRAVITSDPKMDLSLLDPVSLIRLFTKIGQLTTETLMSVKK